MNSISEKKLSLDELKALNSRDLSEANSGERHITVTERNWTAVLNLLGRLSSQQLEVQAALGLLLTRPDAEQLLRMISGNAAMELQSLSTEVDRFAEQAGRMNERFSSAAGGLVTTAEKELRSITSSAEYSLRELRQETAADIRELVREARRWIRATGAACIAGLVLLTALFGWAMLRQL